MFKTIKSILKECFSLKGVAFIYGIFLILVLIAILLSGFADYIKDKH